MVIHLDAPHQERIQGAEQLLYARPAGQARPGTGSAMFRLGPEELAPRRTILASKHVSTASATRNPALLFAFRVSFLLRMAQRMLRALLMKEPPRRTRGHEPVPATTVR